MKLTLSNVLSLVGLTLRDPREGLRAVLSQPLGLSERWLVFALSIILPTLLIAAGTILIPMPDGALFPFPPVTLAILQGVAMGVMVVLTYLVGRWRGGRGSFADCLLTVSWLQIVMVAMQAALLLVELALPPLAAILSIVATLLMFWLLTNFVVEVHGFTSLPMTFLGIMGAMFVAAFLFALILAPFLGVQNV
ncbi:YIP1 family protein [Falsirhodobacter xinxiangensis]|uniref:YIP1 family protein n=1 Tax=Falsirhodobacter xinxiangensis TaxID=2530049 RepID=UPI0010AACBA7|nr:YIP1 family protein [Rhodobacter xinxiangensis]